MMEWGSWAAFWSMGGNGLFVWGSYAVTFACLAVELVLVIRRRKETVLRLLRLRRAAPAGAGARRTSEESFE